MFRPRVIPCLLLQNLGLVKTTKFKKPRYVGDPMNAIRIFNKKQADELIFLDINATKEKRIPPLDLIKKIGEECFMPFAVGGGIRTIEDIRRILRAGAEKVVINSYAVTNPGFIKEASRVFGAQSIVVSVDVKKRLWGKYEVYTHCGSKAAGIGPVEFVKKVESYGAGEIFLNSIDNDGTMEGYDINLVRMISDSVGVPVIACGGAGSLDDFREALIDGNAFAVSAGSFFVFHGRRRAVLINYPTREELSKYLSIQY